MQSTVRGDDFEAGAQPQVKGVAEADLGADLVQVTRGHCFNRAVGADRHEDRCFDDAMRQGQAAASGETVGSKEFKVHFF